MSDIDTYYTGDVEQGEGWQGEIARINRNLVRGMVAALVVIAVGTVLMILFLLGWLDRSSDSDRITELEDSQDRLFTGYDQLFDQVEELGETPVAPPPQDIIDEPADRPEVQEQEQQDSERQDPEIQDPEIQDPEVADAEVQDPEVNDLDPFDDLDLFDDPDPTDDPEVQDEEIQDPEIQDPEIDDPDPGGTCPTGTTAQALRVATGAVDAPGQFEFVTIVACVPN